MSNQLLAVAVYYGAQILANQQKAHAAEPINVIIGMCELQSQFSLKNTFQIYGINNQYRRAEEAISTSLGSQSKDPSVLWNLDCIGCNCLELKLLAFDLVMLFSNGLYADGHCNFYA
ncbi:hypothetical protein NMYAN_210008 [Nitrosomonas nitrosa]|uniref:Uncharacterized protein n=1 Tax=Nitrosomonas nitrosa TaxID=52442 RepID=A0A8H8Z237_9PROT|nr:hypothetical protein NMYAN_210008 [Nitrosomonas nitrosa]